MNTAYLVESSISAASQPPSLSFLYVELRLAEFDNKQLNPETRDR